MKKIIVFDLDKTLAESKSNITLEMGILLKKLLEKYEKIAIISGGDYPQFQKQVLPFIEMDISRLILCPTSGTKMYVYKENSWTPLYIENIDEISKNNIKEVLNLAIDTLQISPEKTWGSIIEDRGTQITASLLGQEAPTEEKEKWDPDNTKKVLLQNFVKPLLPDFEVNFGGSTSIDILKKGITKAYGIQKIMDIFGYQKEDFIFIGDRLYPGGNDYPVFEMGIESIKTEGSKQTMHIIKELLEK